MSKGGRNGGSFQSLAVHLLHRGAEIADRLFESEVDSLTPRQFAVLARISESHGLSQTDIVDRTGVDRSTIADLVRRLTNKGLLQRRRNKEDARAYVVRLSDTGREALRSVQPKVVRAEAALFARLTGVQRKVLVEALKAIGSV